MSTPLNLNFPQIEIQFMLRDTFSLDSKASQLYPPYSQNGIDTKNLTVLAYLCPSFRFSKSPMQFRTFNAICDVMEEYKWKVNHKLHRYQGLLLFLLSTLSIFEKKFNGFQLFLGYVDCSTNYDSCLNLKITTTPLMRKITNFFFKDSLNASKIDFLVSCFLVIEVHTHHTIYNVIRFQNNSLWTWFFDVKNICSVSARLSSRQ